MRWTTLLLIATTVSAFSAPLVHPSAPPPLSAAKEAGVSVTCRLRDGGTKFLLNATLTPMRAGVIKDPGGKELSGSLSDYWKIGLDPEDGVGNSTARLWKKGEKQPLAAIIWVRPKSGSGQTLVLHGYDKDKRPQTFPLASCSEVRIRQ